MKKWIVPAVAALIGTAVSIIFYKELPDMMAVHFGTDNSPDRYQSKALGAFMLPVLILAVTAVIQFVGRLERDENKRKRTNAASGTVLSAISAVLLAVHFYTLAFNLGYTMRASLFAMLAVGFIFITVGNVMPRLPQGPRRFPRMSDAAYARYARFNGRNMVAAGFLTISAALLPSSLALSVFGIIAAAFVITVVVSAIYFDR